MFTNKSFSIELTMCMSISVSDGLMNWLHPPPSCYLDFCLLGVIFSLLEYVSLSLFIIIDIQRNSCQLFSLQVNVTA